VAALQHVLDLQTQLRTEPVQPDDLLGCGRDLLETADEHVHLGPPVDLPGVGMGVTEPQRRLRPQIAVRHRADHAGRRCLDRRRVGQPPVQVGAPGAVPPLPVQLTHPAACGAVAAPGHLTLRVRALPAPPVIGGRGEHLRVGVALVNPAQMMARTHALAASGPRAAPDAAGAAAEHRVLGGEHQHLGAELGPDRAQQQLQQRRTPCGRRPGRRPHSRTALAVNQPACSNIWRASSTPRCP
jgi:hypothetical protein